MIAYIGVLFAIALIIVVLWLVQPYKNWKKNFDARQYEPISITDRKRTKSNISDYLSAQ